MKKIILFIFVMCYAIIESFAQKKTIKDYYQLWVTKEYVGDQAIFKPDDSVIDVANGYCSFTKMGAAQMHGSMALWRTESKGDIIGVFTYGCQLGKCEGMVEMVKFYDSQLNEITEQVFSKSTLAKDFKSKLDHIQARGANGDETFFCEIPQKGTTVKFMIKLGEDLMLGDWKMPVAELKFDKKTGKFTYQLAK